MTETVQTRTDSRLMALIVSVPMFMGQLDSTVFVMALPAMAETFDMPPVNLSIGITVYLLVQAALLPASNWVADRFGARTVLTWAIVGFIIASILCGLSANLGQFVAARVFQAISATLMVPIGRLVLLRVTAKSDLVNVLTITTVPMLLAPTLGPPIGGFITTFLSWPWIFYLNVPFGILSIILTLRFIPNIKEEKKKPFDFLGFVVTGAALSCLIYGVDRISAPGVDWRAAATILVIGLALGAYAIHHARVHRNPLLSFSPFKIKTFFITTITGGSLVRVPARAISFILPIMFQIGFGMSAFRAGLLVMMVNAGDLALKPFLAKLFRAFGFPVLILVSTVLMMATIALCALFQPSTPAWIIILLLTASGMFRSILIAANVTLAYAELPQNEIGNASLLGNVMQQVVSAAGISFATILLNMSIYYRGAPAGAVSADDCRFALIGIAVIGLLAMLSFRHLPRDAGVETSGHRKFLKSRPKTDVTPPPEG